jgi:rubrerythrin
MAEFSKLSVSETHILDICCKVEETCADLYRYFSRIYADSPQISVLWEKTAKEEDSHAEHFRLASRLKGSGIQSLKSDMYNVAVLLKKIQTIYASVQKSPPPLKEALKFAIKLEESMADYHMDTIASFEDKDLERLFASMMKNDKDHIVMLEQAYKELFE